MTVLPVPYIPSATLKAIGSNPPAGLVVLEKPRRVLPPAGEDGNVFPQTLLHHILASTTVTVNSLLFLVLE